MQDDDLLTTLVVEELKNIAVTSRGIAKYAMEEQGQLDKELAADCYSKDTWQC